MTFQVFRMNPGSHLKKSWMEFIRVIPIPIGVLFAEIDGTGS